MGPSTALSSASRTTTSLRMTERGGGSNNPPPTEKQVPFPQDDSQSESSCLGRNDRSEGALKCATSVISSRTNALARARGIYDATGARGPSYQRRTRRAGADLVIYCFAGGAVEVVLGGAVAGLASSLRVMLRFVWCKKKPSPKPSSRLPSAERVRV